MNSHEAFYQANLRRSTAYAPNSKFKVGVFLETNKLAYSASNVEHANSALNVCAERMALSMALMYGHKPIHLHLVTDNSKPTFPCGICRQYMSMWPRLLVTVYSSDGTKKITKTSAQLLPNPFVRDRVF